MNKQYNASVATEDNQSRNHDDINRRNHCYSIITRIRIPIRRFKQGFPMLLFVQRHRFTPGLSLHCSPDCSLIKSVPQNGFLPSNTLGSSLFAVTSTNAALSVQNLSRRWTRSL